MNIFSLILALFLFDFCLSHSIPKSLILHEKRDFDPSATHWVKRSMAPRNVKLPIRIAISQRNVQNGQKHLMEISDPVSAKFGQHWTPQQVHDFFSPDPTTLKTIQDWLLSSGIEAKRHKIAGSHGSIQFEASVEEVEQLLGTRYDVWENHETGALTISCDHYHVPAYLQNHIDFITPTTGFDLADGLATSFKNHTKQVVPKTQQRLRKLSLHTEGGNFFANTSADPPCADFMTPQCIQNLYGIPSNQTRVVGNDLGIFGCGDTYDQEDLYLFFSKYATNIPKGTHPELQSIDGAMAPVPISSGGGESVLDFSLAYPIIYPQGIKLYQTFDSATVASIGVYGLFDIFLDALDVSFCSYNGGDDPNIDPTYPTPGYNATRMCGTYAPTNVISLSYGLAEAYYPRKYAERQCFEYLKLGLQGTSVIFASGDNGTVSRAGLMGCLSSNRDNPTFPASCPWVTSVGATQLVAGNTTRETAVNPQNAYFFSSGGGFSNVFPRASYQDTSVSEFLDNTPRDTSLFSLCGRGFPDVAANGWNIATIDQGYLSLSSGTSASAPLFAAMISRIVGERLAAGKGSLGFLNPVLYAYPEVFRDIDEGYNLGCGAVVAFNATKGWDPVTGLGTPDFERLRGLLVGLP